MVTNADNAARDELSRNSSNNGLPRPQEQRLLLEQIRNNVPFIAITLVILLFWAVGGDRFLSVRNWRFIAQQTPVLVLLAFAQLIVVTTGSIDISVGSNLGFSAFVAALGMTWFGPAGVLLGVVSAVAIGTLSGSIFSFLKISSFMTTLAMQIIVRALLIIVSGGGSIYITDYAVSGGTYIDSVQAPWLISLGKFPNILIFALIVTALMWVLYEKTAFGQQLKALGGNEKVLTLAGVNVTWVKVQVFAVVGFMVGLASIINLARSGAATPLAGSQMELDSIAAVALGGTPLTGGYGGVLKTVIGALTLTVVSNGLTIAGVPPSWSDVARGALLVAAIAISLNRQKIDVVK